MNTLEKEDISDWFQGLQDTICHGLEKLDGKSSFVEDKWKRADGGGGRTRTFKEGDLIEKGGVNFSAVHGPTPTKILDALKLKEADFFATGVSIVLHPNNPWVPIIHMNVRYFEMDNGVWWFGGGIDLTPHIIIEEKAQIFHDSLKKICDSHHENYYPKFKIWADDYFYLPHRNETRGVGGIFFDRLSPEESISKDDRWNFVKDLGSSFVSIYTSAVKDLRSKVWADTDREWQEIRRGRYVEFNLVHDKGTKFGLDTDGRTESILVSMPPRAQWHYDFKPTDEEHLRTQSLLKKGINWISK
ncbi:MAG: oxygen-dependent coproporphyrinogen oxidase [Cyclobacteriaceae bacterium]